MSAQIRRTILHQQTTHEEGGKPLAKPTLLVAAIAIIRNPWFGRGFVEDLKCAFDDLDLCLDRRGLTPFGHLLPHRGVVRIAAWSALWCACRRER